MNTRRETLKLLLAGAGVALGADASSAPVATRIIDTHTHFYDPTRPQGVPWPSRGSPLFRPVYPKDWAAVANPHGIRETVVVEASPWPEDNDWLLNLAAKEKSIVGVVGHLLPSGADFESQLTRLAANPLFRGIRVSGADLKDNIASEEFVRGCQLLATKDLSLDVNGLTDPAMIATLAAKVSNLRIIIDHCGNGGDPKKLTQVWKDGMIACAKQKTIFVKASALVEMVDAPAGKAPTDVATYLPILDFLWEQFGADRLLFASNWPVSDKGADYAGVFKIVSDYFTTKGSEACEKYFWKNALAAYKWVERK